MSGLSARAKILRYAEENKPFLDPVCDPETGFFVDDPEAHLSGLLDAFAHELAEKQRAAAQAEFDKDVYIDELSMRFVGMVIDLIDPQVSAGPVRPDEEPRP